MQIKKNADKEKCGNEACRQGNMLIRENADMERICIIKFRVTQIFFYS